MKIQQAAYKLGKYLYKSWKKEYCQLHHFEAIIKETKLTRHQIDIAVTYLCDMHLIEGYVFDYYFNKDESTPTVHLQKVNASLINLIEDKNV